MNQTELDNWWASLPIVQKERIARKALSKASPDKKADESQVTYPACSRWWGSLDAARQTAIHDHCVSHHHYLLNDWQEGDPYGD